MSKKTTLMADVRTKPQNYEYGLYKMTFKEE
jgi:hypothetical protein